MNQSLIPKRNYIWSFTILYNVADPSEENQNAVNFIERFLKWVQCENKGDKLHILFCVYCRREFAKELGHEVIDDTKNDVLLIFDNELPHPYQKYFDIRSGTGVESVLNFLKIHLKIAASHYGVLTRGHGNSFVTKFAPIKEIEFLMYFLLANIPSNILSEIDIPTILEKHLQGFDKKDDFIKQYEKPQLLNMKDFSDAVNSALGQIDIVMMGNCTMGYYRTLETMNKCCSYFVGSTRMESKDDLDYVTLFQYVRDEVMPPTCNNYWQNLLLKPGTFDRLLGYYLYKLEHNVEFSSKLTHLTDYLSVKVCSGDTQCLLKGYKEICEIGNHNSNPIISIIYFVDTLKTHCAGKSDIFSETMAAVTNMTTPLSESPPNLNVYFTYKDSDPLSVAFVQAVMQTMDQTNWEKFIKDNNDAIWKDVDCS